MEGPNYTLPEDILAEINLLAETEADRLALIRTATILSGRPQLARAHVALSQGSMARLNKVFEDYPILEGDDRDVLMMAHDSVDYDAGYFIEPFDVIKLRPRKTPLRKMKTAPLARLIDLTMDPEDGKKLKAFLGGPALQPNPDSDAWLTQELVDFLATEKLYFFGLLDWKEDQRELATFIQSALVRNFDLDIVFSPPWNSAEWRAIDLSYAFYGEILRPFEIALCHLDIDSDSYQPMLVRAKDVEVAQQAVQELGFELKHWTTSW